MGCGDLERAGHRLRQHDRGRRLDDRAEGRLDGRSGPAAKDPDYYEEGTVLLHQEKYHEALTSFRLALRESVREWEKDRKGGGPREGGNGDGQVFAIIVITVAACEVCVGLGVIVAMYRRRLPIDVDDMRELHG